MECSPSFLNQAEKAIHAVQAGQCHDTVIKKFTRKLEFAGLFSSLPIMFMMTRDVTYNFHDELIFTLLLFFLAHL